MPNLPLLRWLAWSGPQHAMEAVAGSDIGLVTERYVVASLLALTQVVRLARSNLADKS